MPPQHFPRAATAVLPATAFVLPPLAVFAPLGMAPLLAIVAVALLALDARRCRDGLRTLSGLIWLLAALGLWASASALWSIIPPHSLFEGARFLVLSAGGLAILGAAVTAGRDERRWVGQAAAIGVAFALILLLIERFANAPITRIALGLPFDQYLPLARFDRGVTALVLMLWPVFFTLGARWRRGLFVVVVGAMTLVMASATAALAALASLAIFAVAERLPRTVSGVMILGLTALAAAIPLATPSFDTVVALHQNSPWIKPSGIHRLLIWRFGADRVAERPLLGWGMDAARALPGGKTDLNTMLPALHYGDRIEAMPLHPHDAALQWQLELGLPGLLLSLAIIAWILWRIGWQAPLTPDRRAGALALASAALTVGMLSFGAWQSWWLSTLWLVAALYAASDVEEPLL
jgi:exopolysaccharide production protein ExoQ